MSADTTSRMKDIFNVAEKHSNAVKFDTMVFKDIDLVISPARSVYIIRLYLEADKYCCINI